VAAIAAAGSKRLEAGRGILLDVGVYTLVPATAKVSRSSTNNVYSSSSSITSTYMQEALMICARCG